MGFCRPLVDKNIYNKWTVRKALFFEKITIPGPAFPASQAGRLN
jgi:hypothetical protein